MKTERIIVCCDLPYNAETFEDDIAAGYSTGAEVLRSTWNVREPVTPYVFETARTPEDTDESFIESHEYGMTDKILQHPES